MTDNEINIAIAEECGPRLFVIYKANRGYYLKDACGYTDNIELAWKLPEELASKHATGPSYKREPDRIINKPAPLPSYTSDLNAMHEAESCFDGKPVDLRSLWLDNLAVCAEWPKTRDALELKFEVSYVMQRLTAAQRAEAFLRTLGKWKE